MKTPEKIKSQSIKSRLKYRALKEGRVVQDIFTMYVLERVLYRLSVSKYKDNFTLKGGILLYGLFGERYVRATTDVDLQAKNISNDAMWIKTVFEEILQITCNDGIRFDLEGLKVKNITEFKMYHGVNVSLNAFLDRTRILVSIDIGYGDVIYPGKQEMTYPTVLDDEAPSIYAYSVESIIAEKFEAIVSLGALNSRYKDFYDICILSENFDFEGECLENAIKETFSYRKTSFENIVAFEEGFANDSYRKGRWKGFLRSKNVPAERTLDDVIKKIKIFLEPLVLSLRNEEVLQLSWSHERGRWI